MLFQKRVDRAMDHLSETQREEVRTGAFRDEYDPKADRIEPELSEIMERGDLPAMLLSAFLVFIPVCLILLLIVAGAGALFLRA